MLLPLKAQNQPEGALTPALVQSLREGYEMTGGDLARHNAITNNDINGLALNRAIVAGEDGFFSHRVQSKGITNQKSSGRCWMFAGLNTMRPRIIHDTRIEDFEFSHAYLQFWDKMEKSNLYLEDIMDLRDADRLDREWLLVNEWNTGDGGWWNYVTGLIEKYGVVPSSVMPETQSSENTKTMNVILGRLLRARAVDLMKSHKEGATLEALRTQKEKALEEVYRFLVLNLGEPPAEFEWRYEASPAKDGDDKKEEKNDTATVENKRLSAPQKYTPKSFYDKFVGVDLQQYVCLQHDPSQPMNRHLRFARASNIAGKPDMDFANIEIEAIKSIAVKSILANEPMWFSANVSIDQSTEHGLMEHKLFDYETLFGLDLEISKTDRSIFGVGASNHAMVLMGVDLVEGAPRKWLVENSWGGEKGNKGTWMLYDRWFDEYVTTVIVNRAHLSEEILAIFEEETESLPAWYPGAPRIQE
ncbi:C1 family peptidase [Verrucomicrobiaceae bacterium 227]